MKRIVILLLIVFFATVAFAAEYGTYGPEGPGGRHIEGRRWVQFELTGNEEGNATVTMSSAALRYTRNTYIQDMISTPGEGEYQPEAPYSIAITDGLGRSITAAGRSTTAVQSFDVPSNYGRNWAVVDNLTVTATGIGEGKKVFVRIILH